MKFFHISFAEMSFKVIFVDFQMTHIWIFAPKINIQIYFYIFTRENSTL